MTTERKISFYILILSVLFMFFSGCIFSLDSKKKEKKPEIISVNISDGEIVNTRDITITWRGNEIAKFYQYTVDGVIFDWTESTYVELTDLDEAPHIFTLQAQKDSVFSPITTINFTIDAIQGPGIVFSPRKISGISYVTLTLEDVTDLMAAHIEIVCVGISARIIEFTQNDTMLESGQIIAFSNDREHPRYIIDIGFGGVPEGISGTFDIGNILVNPMKNTGTIIIDVEKTEFRDNNNNTIAINGLDMVRIEK